METILFVIVPILVLLGSLFALYRDRTRSHLYTGVIDDRFLKYFEKGAKYTLYEFIKHVDYLTRGGIQLEKEALCAWLEDASKRGALSSKREKIPLEKGYYEANRYFLPETAQ